MRSSILVIVLALASACGKEDPPASSSEPATSPPSPTPSGGATAKEKATTIFSQRCVPCHGTSGNGDGAASASLSPKPRAFGDVEWQKSVADDHIVKVIKFGGAAVGKSPAMPGNPDLSDPEVVAALKDIIRSFGSK
jgi:cytochrome c551/c552